MISNFPDEPPPGVPATPEQMRRLAICPTCAQAVIAMATAMLEKDLGIDLSELPPETMFEADFDLHEASIKVTVEGYGSKTYPVIMFDVPPCDS